MNTVNQQWTLQLQYPNHVFAAPEDASPCEVYNFSVTAENFENVPLFDQKSHFFKDFVPLFAFDSMRFGITN